MDLARAKLPFESSTSGYSQVTKEEYAGVGSKQLGQQLEEQLRQQGKKPYVISVGGSDATGTFGYLAATQEILEQAGKGAFTDIVNVSHHISTSAHMPKYEFDDSAACNHRSTVEGSPLKRDVA